MASTDLFAPPESSPKAHPLPKKRFPTWLLPASLAAAFGLLFLWFLRDRLLPSQAVTTAPVILLDGIDQTEGREAETNFSPDPEAAFAEPMRFQAAGWFEPDPLPIRATALVDGVIDRVHVLEGETVSKGQPLASLIADDVTLEVAASKRRLDEIVADHHMHLATIPAVKAKAESVRSQMEAAVSMLNERRDREERLGQLSPGTVSDQEITAAKLAVEAQQSEVEALKAAHAAELAKLDAINAQSTVFNARIAAAKVAIAQKELAQSRLEITSPVDGVVLELKATPGQKKMLAMDNPDSATVAVLFETGRLQSRVDVPLTDAAGLVPGQAALITSDFLPNAEFRGRVTRIVGAADLQRNTLQAKVRVLDPDPRLRPEMLCRVKFLQTRADRGPNPSTTTSASTHTLFVPIASLLERNGNRAAVWTVSPDGRRALRKAVVLRSQEANGHIALESGLLAGEQVILPPHAGLADGRRITPSPSTP